MQVNALPHQDLVKLSDGEASATITLRVEAAAALQLARQGKYNNLLSTAEIDAHCKPDAVGERLPSAAIHS